MTRKLKNLIPKAQIRLLMFFLLDESVKRDLKDWNISKEIALDRSAWRLAINVSEP